jgi:hypothetical protein
MWQYLTFCFQIIFILKPMKAGRCFLNLPNRRPCYHSFFPGSRNLYIYDTALTTEKAVNGSGPCILKELFIVRLGKLMRSMKITVQSIRVKMSPGCPVITSKLWRLVISFNISLSFTSAVPTVNCPFKISSLHDIGSRACSDFTHSFRLFQGLPQSRRHFALYCRICFGIVSSVIHAK